MIFPFQNDSHVYDTPQIICYSAQNTHDLSIQSSYLQDMKINLNLNFQNISTSPSQMSACQTASTRSIHQLIYKINHFCHFDVSLALRGLYMILVMNWNWYYQGWIVQCIKAARTVFTLLLRLLWINVQEGGRIAVSFIFVKAEWFYLLTCIKVIDFICKL